MVFLLRPSHSPFPISSLDHRTFDPSIIDVTSALFWILALRHHHPCHRTMPASSFHCCITEKRVVFLVKILQLTSPHLSPHNGISTSLSILAPLHRQLKLFLIHTMNIILSTLLQKLFHRFYPFLNFNHFPSSTYLNQENIGLFHIKSMCRCPPLFKFALQHLAFTKDLHWSLLSQTKKKSKEDFSLLW